MPRSSQATKTPGAPAAKAETEQTQATYAGPRSLMRVLRILDAAAKDAQGLSLAEISAKLVAPKSSLLLLLRALTTEGYLTHSGGLYTLGSQSYRLASEMLSGRKLTRLLRPYMEELSALTQETVILGVIDKEAQTVIYIDVIESPQMVRYSIPAGTTRPLYATSSGRVLLTWQDEAWRRNYISKVKLKPLTPVSVTDRALFEAEIEKIRINGYSVSRAQAVSDAAAVGAPVFSATGNIVAALSVGCPSDRFNSQKQVMTAAVVDVSKRAAGII